MLLVITKILILLIAILHIYFLVLEMFLWNKPIGRKIFKTEKEFAEKATALAANQGLYNGFLAAGLLWNLWTYQVPHLVFFLLCIFLAGVYGSITVNRRIVFIQAQPALIALFLLYIG